MTREEAIKLVKEVTGMSLDWDDAHYDALQMAIKALEQEPVLDKIRAEIEQGYCEVNNDYDQGRNYGLYMATQIIDKYKTESEEK